MQLGGGGKEGSGWCIVEGMVDSGKDRSRRRVPSPAQRAHSLALRFEKNPERDSIAGLRELKLDSLLSEAGVLVRRAFISRLERVAKRIEQENMDHVRRVVIMGGDLRNLKEINAYDQKLGDSAIVNAGQVLAKYVRGGEGDMVGRIGGDEFMLILLLGDDEGEVPSDRTVQRVMEEKMKQINEDVDIGRKSLFQNNPFLADSNAGRLDMAWRVLSREQFAGLVVGPIREGDVATALQALVDPGIKRRKSSG